VEFDALLLLSFGGPEGPEQVRPFLDNVTRGRAVPAARLDAVAEHYQHFGGVSPINAINRALIAALRDETPLPVYFGNRNWRPYIEDAVAAMAADGVRRAAVFATSAWGGYSSCRQYVDDIARARASVGPDAPDLIKLRHFFDHPAFVGWFADAITAAAATLPAAVRPSARLVFTAHSIPLAAESWCGDRLYARQVAAAAALVAAAAGHTDHDVVWQSRSGSPRVPWLEPDVGDHLAALADAGTTAVIVCPIGFVADHIEVVWDLDHELREQADRAGIAFARAGTPGADRRFARLVVGLIDEVCYGRPPLRAGGADPVELQGASVNGAPCAPACRG